MDALDVPFESDLDQTVLCDLNLGPSFAHPLSQILHLGHGQAGIMRHDHDGRGLEDLVQRGDGFFLFRSVHSASPGGAKPPGRLLPSRCSQAPIERRSERYGAAPVPDEGSRPIGRGNEPKSTRPSDRTRWSQIRLSPSMLASSDRPVEPERHDLGEIKRSIGHGKALARPARRQSRTGHGRTRREEVTSPVHRPYSDLVHGRTADEVSWRRNEISRLGFSERLRVHSEKPI